MGSNPTFGSKKLKDMSKIYDLKVAISDRSGMNELVDKICELSGKDVDHIRTKFKMKKQADLKKALDLCKFLKLKAHFDPTGEKNYLTVEFPEDRIVKEEVPAEEPKTEEAPAEEVAAEAPAEAPAEEEKKED